MFHRSLRFEGYWYSTIIFDRNYLFLIRLFLIRLFLNGFNFYSVL